MTNQYRILIIEEDETEQQQAVAAVAELLELGAEEVIQEGMKVSVPRQRHQYRINAVATAEGAWKRIYDVLGADELPFDFILTTNNLPEHQKKDMWSIPEAIPCRGASLLLDLTQRGERPPLGCGLLMERYDEDRSIGLLRPDVRVKEYHSGGESPEQKLQQDLDQVVEEERDQSTARSRRLRTVNGAPLLVIAGMLVKGKPWAEALTTLIRLAPEHRVDPQRFARR